MFYATVKAICVLSLTSGHPSEPDASGRRFAVGFVGLSGAGGRAGVGGGGWGSSHQQVIGLRWDVVFLDPQIQQ